MMLRCLGFFLFSCAYCAVGFSAQTCAHRGDNKVAPENTVPAFLSAANKHVAQIEFDIRLTKDGEMVVIHDASVDRTTNGKGNVAEMTFEEIRKLDAGSWFDPKFAGVKIPTPREVLEAIPPDILCNLHLKEGPDVARDAAMLLKDMGRLDSCFLACSVEQALEAKAVAAEVKICNMSRQGGDRAVYADGTIAAGAQYIQFLGEVERLKPLVDKLHEHGVKVNYFEAHTEDKIRACMEAGVDFILTNDLDLCARITGDKKSDSPIQ
jgi:glycerophosphoryl diester phosphodiesterase